MVQGKINRGRHTNIRLGATPSRPTSAHLHYPPHVSYRLDALPATQPTASKHWRQEHWRHHPRKITHWPPAFMICLLRDGAPHPLCRLSSAGTWLQLTLELMRRCTGVFTGTVSATSVFVMATLWNRAGHYIFALWFLSSSILFSFLA